MKMPAVIDSTMLAPCGVNCAVCLAHVRQKNRCGGCQGDDCRRRKSCRGCARKQCAEDKGLSYCFECADFPCQLIKTLDKSYRTRYQISLIANGETARAEGVEAFLAAQRARFTCPGCGGVVCQHDGLCSECRQPMKRWTL